MQSLLPSESKDKLFLYTKSTFYDHTCSTVIYVYRS